MPLAGQRSAWSRAWARAKGGQTGRWRIRHEEYVELNLGIFTRTWHAVYLGVGLEAT